MPRYQVEICYNLFHTLADFGISMWNKDKSKDTSHVVFYKAKDVYDVGDIKETLDFHFDIRLFGIVLAKLLLCGSDVNEKELYDWKTGAPQCILFAEIIQEISVMIWNAIILLILS